MEPHPLTHIVLPAFLFCSVPVLSCRLEGASPHHTSKRIQYNSVLQSGNDIYHLALSFKNMCILFKSCVYEFHVILRFSSDHWK